MNDSTLDQYDAFGEISQSEKIYSDILNWVTIISAIGSLFAPLYILIFPDQNLLNPGSVFGTIFEGKDLNGFWSSMGGSVQYIRSYFTNPQAPDAWAQFFIELGCASALLALIPAIIIQIFKEKRFFDAVLGVLLAALIALSMFGIIS